MKFSIEQLKKYLSREFESIELASLAHTLTHAGFEVEGSEDPAKNFHDVVIGQIVKLEAHPNADRLTLCQVEVGTGSKQIVCGAKNHKEGDRVVVALPGAELPNDFKIKAGEIRGVLSEGMLCSLSELGLAAESAGILILPIDAPVGVAFANYHDPRVPSLGPKTLEINITPNRTDVMSYIGLAREVSALLGLGFCEPEPQLAKLGSYRAADSVTLAVKAHPPACGIYLARAVRGLKIQASPAWLISLLNTHGIKSINNVVDVTNLVMLEYGHPLHAFDMRSVEHAQLRVDWVQDTREFVALDTKTYKLNSSDLAIWSNDRVVALAGVMGGLHSGVASDTTDILLEAAHFDARSVRNTSRRLGLMTESALRFSRGVNPRTVESAMNRALSLITELAGGQISADQIEFRSEVPPPPRIPIRTEYVEQRLGLTVRAPELRATLEKLGGELRETAPGSFEYEPPSYRMDLELPEDLIEEHARIKGYDLIDEVLPVMVAPPAQHSPIYTRQREFAQYLTGLGFFEASNFVLSTVPIAPHDPQLWQSLGIQASEASVSIANPISEDLKFLRQNLSRGLLENLEHNVRFGLMAGKLFEIGVVATMDVNHNVQEACHLGVICWGEDQDWWHAEQACPLLLEFKSSLEAALNRMCGAQWGFRYSAADASWPGIWHPQQAQAIYFRGRNIGVWGSVHPRVLGDKKINVPVVYAELRIDDILSAPRPSRKNKPLSRMSLVERDLALMKPSALPMGQILDLVRKEGQNLLEDVVLFDLYQSGNEVTDQLAFGLRLRWRAATETLTDEQVHVVQTKIVEALQRKLHVTLRG